MTWSGPCIYHCGSSINVGVNVKVGSGVAEGEAVDVPVGNTMGVMVAGSVGEGSRSAVQVGSMIRVGGAKRLNPPHPISRRAVPDIQKIKFLVIARKVLFLTTT
jgi:hypothetical protein